MTSVISNVYSGSNNNLSNEFNRNTLQSSIFNRNTLQSSIFNNSAKNSLNNSFNANSSQGSIFNNSDEKGYYHSNDNVDEMYYYNRIELFPVKIITVKKLLFSVRVNETGIKLKNIKKKMTMVISNLKNQYTRINNSNIEQIPFYNIGSIVKSVKNNNSSNQYYEIIDIVNDRKEKFSRLDEIAYLKLKDINKSTYLTTVLVPGYKSISDYIIIENIPKQKRIKKINSGNEVFIKPNTSKKYIVNSVNNNNNIVHLINNNGIYEEGQLEKFNQLKHAVKSTVVINEPMTNKIGKNTSIIGTATKYLYKFNPGEKVKIKGNNDNKEYIVRSVSQTTGKVELIDNSTPDKPILLRRSLKTNNIQHVNDFSELLKEGNYVYTIDKISNITKNNPAKISKKITGILGNSKYIIEKQKNGSFKEVPGKFKAENLIKVKKTNISGSIITEKKLNNLSIGKRVIIKNTKKGPFRITGIKPKSLFSSEKYVLSNGKEYTKNRLALYIPAPLTSRSNTVSRSAPRGTVVSRSSPRGTGELYTPSNSTLNRRQKKKMISLIEKVSKR